MKSWTKFRWALALLAVAGAGYLNVFFHRAKFLIESQMAEVLPSLKQSENVNSQKVCVEHTSVNPNKSAHIGHVRNSVLGDTFVRSKACLRHLSVFGTEPRENNETDNKTYWFQKQKTIVIASHPERSRRVPTQSVRKDKY